MKNNMKDLKEILLNEGHEDKEINNAIDVLANHFKDYNIDVKEAEKAITYLLDKISNSGDNETVFNAIEKWTEHRK